MAFELPPYIYPLNEKLVDHLTYEEITVSALSSPEKDDQPQSFVKPEKILPIKHEEIDFTSSS